MVENIIKELLNIYYVKLRNNNCLYLKEML